MKVHKALRYNKWPVFTECQPITLSYNSPKKYVKTWRGVTCKRCLKKHKPSKRGKGRR